MKKNSGKSSLYLYRIWLLLYAACCVGISLFGERMPSACIGKLFGILACALMVLLSVISFVTGDIRILGLLDQETEAELPLGQRRGLIAAACAVFLAGAAAEAGYAVYDLRTGYTSLMRDALVNAAIYTAALLLARRILTCAAERKSES